MKSLLERFEAKYTPVPETGCWLWLGTTTNDGYGGFGMSPGDYEGAHRASWRLNRGPVPAGLHVCHRCDTPSCVNPDHLFLGTPLANVQDKVNKGRQARGEANGNSHLTEATVRQILCATGVQREIAERFGVHQSTVSKIKSGRLWRAA